MECQPYLRDTGWRDSSFLSSMILSGQCIAPCMLVCTSEVDILIPSFISAREIYAF